MTHAFWIFIVPTKLFFNYMIHDIEKKCIKMALE